MCGSGIGFVVQPPSPSFRHFTLECYFSNLANLSACSADVSPHFPSICSFLTRSPFLSATFSSLLSLLSRRWMTPCSAQPLGLIVSSPPNEPPRTCARTLGHTQRGRDTHTHAALRHISASLGSSQGELIIWKRTTKTEQWRQYKQQTSSSTKQ